MKLYHVSYDKISKFVPRIPKDRLLGEDGTVPRICLSISIENCINAKPNQAEALFLAREQGIPMPIYVYEFDSEQIPADKLVEPQILYDKYDVLDALDNKEYWLLDGTVPYVETRYECIGGNFLPADNDSSYAEVLWLTLARDKSQLAERLEKAVFAYSCMFGKSFTTDWVMINLADEIAGILEAKQDGLDACSIEFLMDKKEEQQIKEVLKNTEKYLNQIKH